jgi:RNA polymerase sigma-70 factor (ECF subfamily)
MLLTAMTQDPALLREQASEAPASAPPIPLEERAKNGDRKALGTLLRMHARAIHQLCHYLTGPVDGLDASQEAMEKIVTGLHHFHPEKGSFRTWSLTVARNTCRDRLRRRGLERSTFASDGETHTELAQHHAPDPERLAAARGDATELERALATLPEHMRTALVLFHLHEATYEEIAQTLDVPMGTVMTWLHRGRKKLRAALETQ